MKHELDSRMDTSAGLDAAPFTPNNEIVAACQPQIDHGIDSDTVIVGHRPGRPVPGIRAWTAGESL
jgi:hypothetical protein